MCPPLRHCKYKSRSPSPRANQFKGKGKVWSISDLSSVCLWSLTQTHQSVGHSQEGHEPEYREDHEQLTSPQSALTVEPSMELSYGSMTMIQGRTSEVDDELDKDFPLMIKTPQLEGPLAFTPKALKVWRQVHIDNSECSLHFCDQLREWKKTKVELQKVLSQAYEEMSKLKQHVVLNEVTQDHIYALHNQVKHAAKCVCKASQGIDQLINIAL